MMAKRHTFRLQAFLKRGAIDTGFGGRGARRNIDVDQPVHTGKVERDDGLERSGCGAYAADNTCAAAIGDDRDLVRGREAEKHAHLIRRARIKHGIRRDGKVAGAQAEQVLIGAAQRMERALIGVVAHAIGTHHRDQIGTGVCMQTRGRQRDVCDVARGRREQ